MNKHIFLFVAWGLFLATLLTLPRIDYVEPDVLFYFKQLPLLFHVSVVFMIVMAVYFRHSYISLFYVSLLSLLIICTPYLMMAQPWFLDTYPFLAESVYIVQNGFIGNIHELQSSPALGLFFGPFIMITGIDPITLIKVYPFLFALLLPFLLYLIADKMKIGKSSLVLAPLLFVSIVWPNELHFCRQSFSLIFYISSWLLTLQLMNGKSDKKFLLILAMQLFIMSMSHPATPVFFIFNMFTVLLFGIIQTRKQNKEFESKTLIGILLISSSFWILWNLFTPSSGIRGLMDMVSNLYRSLSTFPTQISGISKVFGPYTPLYGLTIDIRLAVTVVVYVVALVLLLYAYLHLQNRKTFIILAGWNLSNMFTAGPLLLVGLPFFARPTLFTFISWAPLGALFYEELTKAATNERHSMMKKALKATFLITIVMIPALLMPIIKYAPVPFTYSTSNELASKAFLDSKWHTNSRLIYLEFNLPYGLYYIIHGNYSKWIRYVTMNVAYVNGSLKSYAATSAIWTTYRLSVRDAFYIYKPSLEQFLNDTVTDFPKKTHNKVYDSGMLDTILLPRPKSSTNSSTSQG